LNGSEKGKYFQAEFEINAISDPEDFIAYLRRAFAISKFWVTFSKPNSFDVNQDFIMPMERLLDASDGEKGKTELVGQNLNADSLEVITRSAATTGNDSGASLRLDQIGPKVKKRLKDNPVVLVLEDLSDNEQKKKLLLHIRELYYKIRGKSGDNI
jgi:hypothetical protein